MPARPSSTAKGRGRVARSPRNSAVTGCAVSALGSAFSPVGFALFSVKSSTTFSRRAPPRTCGTSRTPGTARHASMDGTQDGHARAASLPRAQDKRTPTPPRPVTDRSPITDHRSPGGAASSYLLAGGWLALPPARCARGYFLIAGLTPDSFDQASGCTRPRESLRRSRRMK